jgi:hypothetical protein
MPSKHRRLYQILGLIFLVQAVCPLFGGLMFSALESENDIKRTMAQLAASAPIGYISIAFWIVTAIFIVALGAALFETVRQLNRAMALTAFGLYLFEAILMLVGQAFVYGLIKTSIAYAASGEPGALSLGSALLSARHFAGEIAMVPFGAGAILFYYLVLKVGFLPKWLALWGLISAPLIMIVVPLGTFGLALPFVLCVPYIPFEFVTGTYLMFRHRKSGAPFLSTAARQGASVTL